ncbi:MAG: TIGR00730 family Rossman fold protein [Rhodospirillales bacterium]
MADIQALSVFCGSKVGVNPRYAAVAETLGTLMAERGVRLVYGGGNIGLMGVLADTVMAAGGEVIGVIPEFLMKYEVGKTNVNELIVVDSMHERKRRMFELSDGAVVLPGGLGTLDEAFEVITWKQLRQHDKPIVVVNVDDYWAPFERLIRNLIEQGFAHPAITGLYSVVDEAAAVFPALDSAPAAEEEVLTSHL